MYNSLVARARRASVATAKSQTQAKEKGVERSEATKTEHGRRRGDDDERRGCERNDERRRTKERGAREAGPVTTMEAVRLTAGDGKKRGGGPECDTHEAATDDDSGGREKRPARENEWLPTPDGNLNLNVNLKLGTSLGCQCLMRWQSHCQSQCHTVTDSRCLASTSSSESYQRRSVVLVPVDGPGGWI